MSIERVELAHYIVTYLSEELERGGVANSDTALSAMDAFEGGANNMATYKITVKKEG